MTGLYFIIPTLFVIFVSFLIVRAASIALMMTGLDEKKAKFQALSAFSGTGFTTKEAEQIVNNPKRRQIVTWLMILGNAGIVTVIVTATSSIATSRGYNIPLSALILVIGVYAIYKIASHRGFIRRWESIVEDRLVKSPVFEEAGTEDLLHFIEGYGLVRVIVRENSFLIGSSIAECKLSEKKALVLGIERGKVWLPIPKADEKIKENDRLIIYGPLKVLKTLSKE